MATSPKGAGKRPGGGTDDQPPENSVGYGRPPQHTRWKKGQSGNPRGRPRKRREALFHQKVDPLRDIVMEEAQRLVDIKEGGVQLRMETARAIVRSINVGAMKGDPRKQKLALEIASVATESKKEERAVDFKTVMSYKAKWDPIFTSALESGKPEPAQLPHPDHVNFDLTTGEMVISGPTTPEAKQDWELLKYQLRENTKLLDKMIAEAADRPYSRSAANRVAVVQRHMRKLEKVVAAGWNWREELGWEAEHGEKLLAQRVEKD